MIISILIAEYQRLKHLNRARRFELQSVLGISNLQINSVDFRAFIAHVVDRMAKTEHTHPLGAVQSTHF